MRRFLVFALFALSFGTAAWPQTAFSAATLAGANAPAITGLCATNGVGLGVCAPDQACGAACDADTPCPDGKFCAVETCCGAGGVCLTPIGDNAGCSNPGTCGSYETCDFVLAHKDFTGLGGLSATV
ncbi:MAG TPA: hypothetical protein VI942_00940, partial [Thermoanaerobaculia bacterium]|nr:hypothetical protein [Thermoanaerobaculia bacterium]